MNTSSKILALLLFCLGLGGCSSPALQLTLTNLPAAKLPARTSTITPVTQKTFTCPVPSQEAPPRVDPLTSPTALTSQVVHILPGNYDTATIETESGTFQADFKGAEGALVKVTLLPNTTHHLKLTVHVPLIKSFGDCVYGGYTMSLTADRTGKPLEIVQGLPPTAAPVTQALGPDTAAALKQVARISLPDKLRPWSAVFSADGWLYSFGFGQGLRKWALPSGQSAGAQLFNEDGMTVSAAFTADGAWLATGAAGSFADDPSQTSVRLWNLKNGTSQLLGHHAGPVECMAFNPSGTLLASGANDSTVILWNPASAKEVSRFKVEPAKLANGSTLIQGLRKLIWVDDDTLLARADAVIYEWKISSARQVLKIGGEFVDLDYSPPAGRMAAVRADGVYLFDPGSDQPVRLAQDDRQSYQQVSFNQDGTLLAAASQATISFWDPRTRKLLGSAPNPAGLPLVFSPDWRYLARVNWNDQYLGIWGVQP